MAGGFERLLQLVLCRTPKLLMSDERKYIKRSGSAPIKAREVSLVPPSSITPYVLPCDEGERLIAGDQLFSFLATQRNTGGKFITLTTLGPKGDRIPEHFHEKHTETFFCLDGIMTMWASGEELQLLPGDFLHIPAGTIHSYRLDAPFTRFVGTLAPGLFGPFFRTMCDPYDAYIFPQTPKPVRFDRVIQGLHELDLKLVGGPPQRYVFDFLVGATGIEPVTLSLEG